MALPETPLTRVEEYLNNIATGEGMIPDVPLTRVEQYLAKIAGQNVAVPEIPLTRTEQYLSKIANGDGDIPEVPRTRVELLLSLIASGDGVQTFVPLTRSEQYLAKIAENGSGSDEIIYILTEEKDMETIGQEMQAVVGNGVNFFFYAQDQEAVTPQNKNQRALKYGACFWTGESKNVFIQYLRILSGKVKPANTAEFGTTTFLPDNFVLRPITVGNAVEQTTTEEMIFAEWLQSISQQNGDSFYVVAKNPDVVQPTGSKIGALKHGFIQNGQLVEDTFEVMSFTVKTVRASDGVVQDVTCKARNVEVTILPDTFVVYPLDGITVLA